MLCLYFVLRSLISYNILVAVTRHFAWGKKKGYLWGCTKYLCAVNCDDFFFLSLFLLVSPLHPYHIRTSHRWTGGLGLPCEPRALVGPICKGRVVSVGCVALGPASPQVCLSGIPSNHLPQGLPRGYSDSIVLSRYRVHAVVCLRAQVWTLLLNVLPVFYGADFLFFSFQKSKPLPLTTTLTQT